MGLIASDAHQNPWETTLLSLSPVWLALTSDQRAAWDGGEALQHRRAKGRARAGNRGALSVVNVKTIIKPTHSLLLVITVCWHSYTLSGMRMYLPEQIFCSPSSKQSL